MVNKKCNCTTPAWEETINKMNLTKENVKSLITKLLKENTEGYLKVISEKDKIIKELQRLAK
jgi:hypothetical protein